MTEQISKARIVEHMGADTVRKIQDYFTENLADGCYYQVPFSAGINAEEETTYSIGKIRKRRFPAGRGSSSNARRSKDGRKPSNGIIYTSEEKSQEIKSAIQVAWEKTMQKDTSKHESRDVSAVERANRSLERQNAKLQEDVKNLKALLKLQGKETGGKMIKASSIDVAASWVQEQAGAKGNVKELREELARFYKTVLAMDDPTWEDIEAQAGGPVAWLMQHVDNLPPTGR